MPPPESPALSSKLDLLSPLIHPVTFLTSQTVNYLEHKNKCTRRDCCALLDFLESALKSLVCQLSCVPFRNGYCTIDGHLATFDISPKCVTLRLYPVPRLLYLLQCRAKTTDASGEIGVGRVVWTVYQLNYESHQCCLVPSPHGELQWRHV